jgi:Rrf2 family protein
MIFSSKAEYGVRLMVELGRQAPDQPTSLKAIADAEGLPLAYLEQVVARLKKAGLVMSARGAHGGYWLARDPAEISMFDVVGALEGAIAPMECFVHDEMERVVCSHVGAENARGCATKLLWTRVQGGIVRSLQTTSLAELVEFSRRTDVGEAADAPAADAPAAGVPAAGAPAAAGLRVVDAAPASNVRQLRIPATNPAPDPDLDPAPSAA